MKRHVIKILCAIVAGEWGGAITLIFNAEVSGTESLANAGFMFVVVLISMYMFFDRQPNQNLNDMSLS